MFFHSRCIGLSGFHDSGQIVASSSEVTLDSAGNMSQRPSCGIWNHYDTMICPDDEWLILWIPFRKVHGFFWHALIEIMREGPGANSHGTSGFGALFE